MSPTVQLVEVKELKRSLILDLDILWKSDCSATVSTDKPCIILTNIFDCPSLLGFICTYRTVIPISGLNFDAKYR